MAGLEQSANVRRDYFLTATPERERPSSKRRLPNGPCNYRDQSLGSCGCTQFWDKESAELHDESVEGAPLRKQSTWCVCSHHACFHLFAGQRPAETTLKPPPSVRQRPRDGGRAQSQAGSQASDYRRVARSGHDHSPARGAHALLNAQIGSPRSVSTSGFPRIPAVCLLSHERRQRAAADAEAGVKQLKKEEQTNYQLSGLGFPLSNVIERPPSVSPTIAEESNRAPSFCNAVLPTARANSIRAQSDRISTPPCGGDLEHVLEFNRTLHLNVEGDTIPDTYDPEDFIQSATEVATPSNADTPRLGPVDQAVSETRTLVDTLMRLTSQTGRDVGQSPNAQCATTGPAPQPPPTSAPATPQEELSQAIRTASPATLQKLVAYLAPLHNLLTSIPNLANTIRDVNARLDHLENYSFNHVQPEEVQQHLESYDGRLLELEHRMDDHESLHKAIDADHGANPLGRQVTAVTDSFGSVQSAHSISSAPALVPIAGKEMQAEFDEIKDRLELLEAAAMPSFANPWEVDVVFLPWGPELRGIWHSLDEPVSESVNALTQESEDWTQNLDLTLRKRRSSMSAQQSSGPSTNGKLSLTSSLALSEAESGWSSEAISNWAAGEVDEWLFPRACGPSNLVYKRLHSRGFVKKVTFRSASSRDIQNALSTAFAELGHHLSYTETDDDDIVDAFPALRAPFIPLRKVHKEARLRFLTRAEMASSALWSAQFLSAGVMMKASGGKKRLYVTQREAYLQRNGKPEGMSDMTDAGKSWTWQDIRELPRFQPDMNSQMEGNDEHCQPKVSETDAKEACWMFVERLDLPPASATSSFDSNHSAPVQLSMRPAGRQWRRSITPSSILKNRQQQPISPTSELHMTRPAHRRARTFSSSVVEQARPSSSKRRLNSSPVKQSSVPLGHGRTGSIASIAPSRPKRRRVATDSLPRLDHAYAREGQVELWDNENSRPPRALPSPFYSSHHELARTSSDQASRSEQSAAVAGKGTPFAYATPYSGPIAGGRPSDRSSDMPGDTEPDDDDGDDGEQSWRGVEDGDERDSSDDSSGSGSEDDDAVGGAQAMEALASFSGDDSGFGSENENDDDSSVGGEVEDEDDDTYFAARNDDDDDDDDDGEAEDDEDDDDEVFDTLLSILEN
ncbi:uncharacterized protein EI97DRAFT_401323 [Westerdykella ornata]|uniref:Uncharacterized protein n=1 Tax=Westerdykella ornata TaxID=318751 RepID=A0A6A6JHV1_WESOR|nr:uncharacterized protein EI97DRAFT_401323 [Westerdykella ornata]KAF2274829.1 hypothetical protein EI97DRAFT_401323 [Westerdykella ornata]